MSIVRDPITWIYPEIEAFRTGMLRVSELHEIYFEESGNPNGKPVVFVHGGPGSGTQTKQRRFFDPRKYRIILFDQRGSGKSIPHASLVENTTWHLVADMEKLRKHLGIEKWQVFGGSWGSTLALAYAEEHPEHVSELVLRGIFLCRQEEIAWLYQNGANTLYPDAWEEYTSFIPLDERGDYVSAYYKRLCSPDESLQLQAAKIWSQWEGKTSKLLPDESFVKNFGEDRFALAFARIECHYFMHSAFFKPDNQLLLNIDRIRHIPAVIVQGRYDVVCPIKSAWDLHKAWPEADFIIVPDAGHSVFEPGISKAVVAATDRFSN